MAHRFSQAALAAVLAAATWLAIAADARAQGYGPPGWISPEPNYYAQPTDSQGLTAALYPCPRPTPPLVGQTFITYEALSPHEFLYCHHECYKGSNGPCQCTKTSITWNHWLMRCPFRPAAEPGLCTPAHVCAK